MSALVQYEEMRVAVERCARIDEASEIRDKAAALQAYARQRDDRDLDVWTSEIKLRASVRIGELVRELETAERVRTDLRPEAETQTKNAAIAEAGLSRSEAYRLQELAGPRDTQAQNAGKAAAEAYFAQSRAEKKPATMDGPRGAVKDAVHATIGKPPPRAPKPAAPPAEPVEPIGDDWVDWTSAVATLAEIEVDLPAMAARSTVMRGDSLPKRWRPHRAFIHGLRNSSGRKAKCSRQIKRDNRLRGQPQPTSMSKNAAEVWSLPLSRLRWRR